MTHFQHDLMIILKCYIFGPPSISRCLCSTSACIEHYLALRSRYCTQCVASQPKTNNNR